MGMIFNNTVLAGFESQNDDIVKIYDWVTGIERSAFSCISKVHSITVSKGNRYFAVADDVLYNKDMTRLILCCDRHRMIVIPDSVKRINPYAFSKKSRLKHVILPAGFHKADPAMFNSCRRLQWISVSTDNKYYTSVDGVLYDKNVTTLIRCPRNRTQVCIPPTVTKITKNAFFSCMGLTSVVIPDSVSEIGSRAFFNCINLVRVTLSASLTKIGKQAFKLCYGLPGIDIPEGVKEIGEFAFSNCQKLIRVTLPGSLTKIGGNAFEQCFELAEVDIPEGVTEIGAYAFLDCHKLARVKLPGSLTSIGANAFDSCYNLTEIMLPDSVDLSRVGSSETKSLIKF